MDFTKPKSKIGCILESEKKELKDDLMHYIERSVKKTRNGNGCIEMDMVEHLYDLFVCAFTNAARSSARHSLMADHTDDEIAIDHQEVKRILNKIKDKLVRSLGQGSCISKDDVAQLKESICNLVDNPPQIPLGERMKDELKFVEAKFRHSSGGQQ